jgi:large subunit ribosomal protein L13
MEKKEYIIDAAGKRLGRVASEAASILLGKNTTSFVKNQATDVTVKVTNAQKLDVTEKKSKETFATYSGYPGGLKKETLAHLGNRRGYSEVVRRVVAGMLPKNKLHKPRMKNLEVSE